MLCWGVERRGQKVYGKEGSRVKTKREDGSLYMSMSCAETVSGSPNQESRRTT